MSGHNYHVAHGWNKIPAVNGLTVFGRSQKGNHLAPVSESVINSLVTARLFDLCREQSGEMVEAAGANIFASERKPRRAALRHRNAPATAPSIKCDATRRAARRADTIKKGMQRTSRANQNAPAVKGESRKAKSAAGKPAAPELKG